MSLSGKKLISASVIYTFGDFLGLGVTSILLVPLYLHYMTPSEYGLYGTVNIMISMLGVLIGFGAGSAVGRFYFIYREKHQEFAYLGSVWLTQTILAVALLVLLGLWGQPLWIAISPNIPFYPYSWFVFIGAGLSFSAGIFSLWLRMQEKPVHFVVLQIANTFFYVILIIFLLVWKKGSTFGVLLAALLSSFFMSVISILFLGRKAIWKPDLNYLKSSYVFGLWMVFGTFLYYLINKSQLFFLQHYSNLSTVGIYNLGLQIGSILTLMSGSFSKAWQPMVYSATSEESASETIARTSRWFIAGMLYITMGLIILSGEVLRVLARPAYYGAGPVIRLVAIGSFLYVLSNLTSSALLYKKRADITEIITLIAAGCNLILSRLLIPRWQVTGAAFAMLISFLLLIILGYIFAQKQLRVHYDWGQISKIIGIGVGLLLIEWLFVSSLPQPFTTLCRLALLIIFPVILVLVGAFNKQEVRLIWSMSGEFVQRLRVQFALGNRR